jgi:hypothetical protein
VLLSLEHLKNTLFQLFTLETINDCLEVESQGQFIDLLMGHLLVVRYRRTIVKLLVIHTRQIGDQLVNPYLTSFKLERVRPRVINNVGRV